MIPRFSNLLGEKMKISGKINSKINKRTVPSKKFGYDKIYKTDAYYRKLRIIGQMIVNYGFIVSELVDVGSGGHN